MKVLFIGGTGNISSAVSTLALHNGIELFHLNRGKRAPSFAGVQTIVGDITDPGIESRLKEHAWDAVVNWIAFEPKDVERDYRLFKGRTKQYVFISSASIYQKPATSPFITESTPLANPFWLYSRNKIACEEALLTMYRNDGFPITIVRPSHTYNTIIPYAIGGGSEYTTVDRIKKGKKVIVHGDGSSLWVMTHADDFAKGFLGLLGHQQAIGQAFHITSDEVLTWDQILQAIAESVGATPHIVHIASETLVHFNADLTGDLIGDKTASVIFDNSKIKRFVPGFVATIPFRQGIKRTIDWFEEDPSRQIIKKETNEWIDTVLSKYEKLHA